MKTLTVKKANKPSKKNKIKIEENARFRVERMANGECQMDSKWRKTESKAEKLT